MTSSPSNKLLLLSSTSSLSSASASSATSNSQLQLTTSTTNDTYPRITVKSRPGALIVRETEKILDEKVIQRTEEISCPITGESKLQTVEYIEKLIETEVSSLQKNKTNNKKLWILFLFSHYFLICNLFLLLFKCCCYCCMFCFKIYIRYIVFYYHVES